MSSLKKFKFTKAHVVIYSLTHLINNYNDKLKQANTNNYIVNL